ncbi:MAG: LysM peptidoglycan-binding domain-containing protein [bacterium]|nr:LysM peptidoglycan-binding domain-containing protein [bacterium]
MKYIFFFIFIVFFLNAEDTSIEEGVAAQEVVEESTRKEISYIKYEIKKGDTLSFIALRHLGDAKKWIELYELNKDVIKNPHKIYPGQIIKLSKLVEEKKEEPTTAIVKTPALPLPPEYKKRFTGDSFIATADWEFDGYIIAFRDERILISEGDVVYVDIGWRQGVMPKSRFLVYKKGKDVFHPETKSLIGYVVKRVAVIEATSEVSEDVSSCKVVRLYEPIEVGDFVRLLKTEEYIQTIK